MTKKLVTSDELAESLERLVVDLGTGAITPTAANAQLKAVKKMQDDAEARLRQRKASAAKA